MLFSNVYSSSSCAPPQRFQFFRKKYTTAAATPIRISPEITIASAIWKIRFPEFSVLSASAPVSSASSAVERLSPLALSRVLLSVDGVSCASGVAVTVMLLSSSLLSLSSVSASFSSVLSLSFESLSLEELFREESPLPEDREPPPEEVSAPVHPYLRKHYFQSP